MTIPEALAAVIIPAGSPILTPLNVETPAMLIFLPVTSSYTTSSRTNKSPPT